MIRKSTQRKTAGRIVRLLPLALLTLWVASCGGRGDDPPGQGQEPGVPVEVVTLRGRAASLRIERVGVLRGSAEVDVVPKVAGRIQEVRAARGQRVGRGDVLAVIEQADYRDGVKRGEAGSAVARANLVQAELNVKRQRTLFEEGITSDAVLEAAESAYQVASAGIQQAETALETAERQLSDTRIVSPFDGYVGARMVEVGTFVAPPAAAFAVVALDPMEIEVAVTDRDVTRVKIGAPAEVSVDAIPGRRFAGEVTEVSVSTDRMSGSFPLIVRVPNPEGMLRDGMTAAVAIEVGQKPDAIVVSPDVLIERGGQWLAYVVRDTVAEPRRVVPGELVAGGIIVEKGLQAGDRLVVKGQAYLDDGTRVRVEGVGS